MSVDQKTDTQPPADPVYEEFQPPSDWDHDKESDTLILMLPGFRKEQLRVHVTSDRVLRLSGERKISENKWRRFRKELPVPESNETSGINAKFEAGMLYVRLRKVTTPIKPQPPTQEPPKPQQPSITDHKPADQKVPKEDKTAESKTEAPTPTQEKKTDYEDSQKKPQKEKGTAKTDQETHETPFQEQKSQKEKGKTETDASEIGEAITSKAQEMHGTSPDGLGKSIVAKMNKRSPTLDLLSGLIGEVDKQNKLANFLALIFLVLIIGLYLYIKNVVKSSFGGTKGQEF